MTFRERLRAKDLLAGIGLCLLLFAHVAYYFPRVVDDVFISLRYAENLATGHGAIFNEGERVEGYSSPAWMLIQAFGIFCGFEPVTFTKIVGIGCLVATAFGSRALARRLHGVEGWPSWIPAYACALNPYLVAWTVLGLETPFHIAAIVLCPLAVHAAVAAPSRRTTALAVLALVALGSSRPESAVYVAINVAAPFAVVRSRVDFVAPLRRVLPVAAIAGAILGALLALRFAYYGELVPNTYFVKGAHSSFAIEKLAALWGQGAKPLEAVLYCAGSILLVVYAVRTRVVAPALSLLFCLYFTAKVEVDWMPSLRHLLPVTVLAPLGWARLVADLNAREAPWRTRIAFALLLGAGMGIASVDFRLSPIEHRTHWAVRKSRAKWSDTWLAYRRIEPLHVKQMDAYAMGQISQCWPVLETSADPVESSWYAGRDIGAIGFYTGVRVFDTAGLVTREVSRSDAWSARGEVPDDLVRLMMEKRPVSADLFDGWDVATGRKRSFTTGYQIRAGGPHAPNVIVAVDRTPPSRAEIARRYRSFVQKFPRLYHLHTLYGEAVGAAVERRLRIIEGS